MLNVALLASLKKCVLGLALWDSGKATTCNPIWVLAHVPAAPLPVKP